MKGVNKTQKQRPDGRKKVKTVTQERILELAIEAALTRWAETRAALNENPKSMILKDREQKRWEEYAELDRMLKSAR